MNPMNDDLGSSFFRGKNSKPTDKEPVSTYREQDEHLWNLENLYGRQEEPQKYHQGRPVRADQ